MIRSFLNHFLPEDEYKRMRIVYFMAEATFLAVAILLLLGGLKYTFHAVNIDAEFIFLLGPFIIIAYVYFRYIFSGIEHTEVATKQTYRKKRIQSGKRALLVGVMFGMLNVVIKGIPMDGEEGVDIAALTIIFIVLYYLFDVISLKRSMKKNKELDD